MGYYSIALKTVIEGMGHEPVIPPYTNKKAMEIGVKLSPESVCLPFKLNVGNMFQVLDKGVDIFILASSGGECRYSYYGLLQKRILKEYNKKVRFVIFGGRYGLKPLIRLAGSKTRFLRAFGAFYKKVKLIELTEDLSWWYRPREINKGETTRVMHECLNMIDKTGKKELKKLKGRIKNRFKKIKIDNNKKVLKVGIIGEIFTLLDQYVNHDLDISLGYLGVEVHKRMRVTSHLKQIILNRTGLYRLTNRARKYLKERVGGHAFYAVNDAIKFKNKGFDGIIDLLPFGCLPEVAVAPILDRIREDSNIPILTISLDEHSGKAGLQTRLEAFVDLIKNEKGISGN